MRLTDLTVAGREPACPALVELSGEASLHVDLWLRILPGQLCRSRALERSPGLAKLMVSSKAQRHYRRELAGAKLLADQHLPTLVGQGWHEGEGGWLLFDWLDSAESLWESWRSVEAEPVLTDGQRSVLGEALELIARMHAQGLWQADLHLDNFLKADGQLYVVDGGGVKAETPGRPLSRERVLENLGVFFAQLPAEIEPFIEELLVPIC